MFLQDLGSTHGTFLNKKQVQPHAILRLYTGDSLRFGASSRLHVLQSPAGVQDAEDRDKARRMAEKVAKLQGREQADGGASAADVQEEEDQGISWGMQEDAPDEDQPMTDMTDDPLMVEDDNGTGTHRKGTCG